MPAKLYIPMAEVLDEAPTEIMEFVVPYALPEGSEVNVRILLRNAGVESGHLFVAINGNPDAPDRYVTVEAGTTHPTQVAPGDSIWMDLYFRYHTMTGWDFNLTATNYEGTSSISKSISLPEPEPSWVHDSFYRGIEILVWMPDGTPYTAYFDDDWHMAALLSTLQSAIDDFLEPEPTKIPTTTTISAPERTDLNEKFNISGILYETESGIPIPNQPINHSYNGRNLGGSTTGVDGDYLKEVSVPEAGVWKLKSDFPGTETFQASGALADVVVAAPPIATAILIAGPLVTGLALFIYGSI